ncbi:sensor histidine kinase [Pseudodesulfovibrio sp.]|uniref:sensor histidine kinase n=1 Tax=unclassified Pseudodesulfovibrio TaxID=2661612 RepID=UPI003B00E025
MTDTSYTRLRLSLMLLTLVLSLVPLFALGFVIDSEFRDAYGDKLTSNLRLVAGNKADALDVFLTERVIQLQMVAGIHTLGTLGNQQALEKVFDTVHAASPSIVDLGVIGQNGRHVAYSGPFDLSEANYKDEPWFHQVMIKGLYISDVFMGFRNFPHFIIAVKRREGGRTWILRATIDSDIFTGLVRNVQSGVTGDAYLINRAGVLQTPSRFGGKILGAADLPEYQPSGGVDVIRWQRGGDELMAGIAPLKHTGWRLVVIENPQEELSPLLRARSLIFALFLVCALMIFAGAYLSVGSVVKRLQKADKTRAAMDAAVMQSNKMASLGKLAAGVAHEINNPLSIIRESAGWIRDIINDGELGESSAVDDLQEATDDIERHVERARTVTHRMLGFARRMEPLQEDVDLNMLASQTVSFLENESRHRNIEVKCLFDQALPLITTDANQVQQVILNLLENAIDAIGQDGVIEVSTRSGDNTVLLDIADSGEGIAPENLSRVFDPFFTTKPTGEGTGLGLSIVYSTLKKLGGDIDVRSERGVGTTFTITLPLTHVAIPGRQEESWIE